MNFFKKIHPEQGGGDTLYGACDYAVGGNIWADSRDSGRKTGGVVNIMDIHECMKCRYYLTHFDDLIICVRHRDMDDIQGLIVTVNRRSVEKKNCIRFDEDQETSL